MINKIKLLRKNLYTFEGKIDFVTYMSAVVLVGLHFLFLLFYIYSRTYVMIAITVIGFLIFNHYVHNGIKDDKLFTTVCYAVITVHDIAAILCIGWTAGYYLWLFTIEVAFFLPSFGKLEDNSKRPLFFGFVFAFIYFGLGFLVPSGLVKPLYDLPEISIIYLFGANSVIVFITIIAFTYFFTTRQKFKEDRLIHLAEYDNLTNIKNRTAINKELDIRVGENEEFALAILDIDLFKNVNDTYGHNAGDYVLKELAKKLINLEGYGIIPARWGGEEFIVLGPSNMNYQEFVDIMQDFRRTIRESEFNYDRSKIKITVSIGIAQRKKKTLIKNTIELADKRLYKAKKSGRNKVIYK